eukprot:4426519-Alexandrium_andersonii.AAC.1
MFRVGKRIEAQLGGWLCVFKHYSIGYMQQCSVLPDCSAVRVVVPFVFKTSLDVLAGVRDYVGSAGLAVVAATV